MPTDPWNDVILIGAWTVAALWMLLGLSIAAAGCL